MNTTPRSAPRCRDADPVDARMWVQEETRIPVNAAFLSARLTVPRSGRHVGGIVFVHGFASEKTENGLFPPLERALGARGWCVVSYDWRGLGKSEGRFADTTLETHAADFAETVSWLKKQCALDDKPLSAVGFSLGATLVAMSMQRGSSLDSATFLSPALRPCEDMWPRYDTPEIRQVLGTRGFLEKNGVHVSESFLMTLRDTDLAPFFANRPKVRLLVCHGTNDERIPFTTSQKIFGTKLRQFQGASHSFRPESDHRARLEKTLLNWYTRSTTARRSGTITSASMDH